MKDVLLLSLQLLYHPLHAIFYLAEAGEHGAVFRAETLRLSTSNLLPPAFPFLHDETHIIFDHWMYRLQHVCPEHCRAAVEHCHLRTTSDISRLTDQIHVILEIFVGDGVVKNLLANFHWEAQVAAVFGLGSHGVTRRSVDNDFDFLTLY